MSIDRTILSTERLELPEVTLCAVTSVNVKATIRALRICLNKIRFGDCVLFTDAKIPDLPPIIRLVEIDHIKSAASYSRFVLSGVVDYIRTSHCLIVQWDGHVINVDRWRPEFLEYDYVGATWPQFTDDHDVGNGGFSLRSVSLMKECRKPGFVASHPEDVSIGRNNRSWLEARGMRFATRELANSFSTERYGDLARSFGYHGAFNMPTAIGCEAFWEVYCGLKERGPIRHDWFGILRQLWAEPSGRKHIPKFIYDLIRSRS